MAYYENITAGRGAIDSFLNALNSQRFANLMLNETISNFSNNITRAGALYDESTIREDALKYQRMQDFYNNKRKDEAFELEKKQAELNMDFAKNREAFANLRQKEALKSDKLTNESLELSNAFKRMEQGWFKNATFQAQKPLKAKTGIYLWQNKIMTKGANASKDTRSTQNIGQ
ncbi:hypothetical protein [Helicobacter phage FrB41M]|uniref:hypothetical protein n=1 Tax=Helicobacter pylori TaxID=210 RepID=UPI000983BFB0|nr:hypothetical protein [Helicobacter pylori]ANT42659.1 hypothetical protein [Helicobacter phage FrB41M]PUD58598.1 hypothetical protein C2R54_08030 [Helicobacter pylori]